MKRVMIFGTFDGIHDGHRHLVKEAHAFGEEVVAVVARDEHVLELKGQTPDVPLAERLELVQCETDATLAVVDDEILGSYQVIVEHRPQLLMFGYDQDELMEDVQAWLEDHGVHLECVQASAFMPEVYRTSVIREQQRETDEELELASL